VPRRSQRGTTPPFLDGAAPFERESRPLPAHSGLTGGVDEGVGRLDELFSQLVRHCVQGASRAATSSDGLEARPAAREAP
jgi:hypothetical protein